jgi:hypothetical protein
MDEKQELRSPPSEVGSSFSSIASSTYFKRRYDGKKTRREVLEAKFGKSKSPTNSSAKSPHNDNGEFGIRRPAAADPASGPLIPDSFSEPQTPPRLLPHRSILGFPMGDNDHHHHHHGGFVEDLDRRATGIGKSTDTSGGSETAETVATSSATTQVPTTLPSLSSPLMPQLEDGNATIGECHHDPPETQTQPQHLQQQENVYYYRIVYRGVVALLKEAHTTSTRSGAYVSYGEIIASSQEMEMVQDEPHVSLRTGAAPSFPMQEFRQPPGTTMEAQVASPPRSVISQSATSVSSLHTMKTSSTVTNHDVNARTGPASIMLQQKAIRVDQVLTGGYAMDATDKDKDNNVESSQSHQRRNDNETKACDQTPKRANTQPLMPTVGPSPLPVADSISISASSISSTRTGGVDKSGALGFLFTKRKQEPIAERIDKPPTVQSGSFLYKVVASTPLPILTGPCMDAPKTKAMLLPGTVHEVCLRILENDNGENPVCFLRLSRRRGWVADRKLSRSSKFVSVPAMKDVTNTNISGDECHGSVVSSSSVATPVSAVRRRHRPPRRRRGDVKDGRLLDMTQSQLPRHVVGTPLPSSSSSRGGYPETPLHHHAFESPMLNTNSSHEKGVMSPSSNISLLSDESSLEHAQHVHKLAGMVTPDRSIARSQASSISSQPSFFLMRVNAPRGLKILDAPHFQVNNLIHGTTPHHSNSNNGTSPQGPLPNKDLAGQTGNQSIFQTMAGNHTTTLTSKIGNPAIFDSITKARKLPRGSIFEASKRVESSGAFAQGAGLIKLSDNSGWAIVPRQEELDDQYRNYHGALSGIKEGEATRAYEEVGNAIVDERHASIYVRVVSRGGLQVSLPPPVSALSDDDTSPTSSAGGSSSVSGAALSHILSNDSDVASSVGSSFLDAMMFRTPKKRDSDHQSVDSRRDGGTPHKQPANPSRPISEPFSTVITCGMCIEVERWTESNEIAEQHPHRHEYARLRGGQGWIPRQINTKAVLERVPAPEFRCGSFWFRVQAQTGIKVRLGPSLRAPSIKSDEGVYFRFECGEFLRSSDVMTVFHRDAPTECFAKLYRNRHVLLHTGHGEVRLLSSLTVQAEWVQVFNEQELVLEECATEPRIERHRQGWRYNVVLDARVQVRKGPSFAAESSGVVLLGGESVLVNERVTGPGETISWLRLKDGQGWAHNFGRDGESLMIPHSLRHRVTSGRPAKPGKDGHEDIAYNAIIARLFHSDLPDDNSHDMRGIRR